VTCFSSINVGKIYSLTLTKGNIDPTPSMTHFMQKLNMSQRCHRNWYYWIYSK